VRGAEKPDGAVLVDDGGRDQPLAGCYRSDRLRAALDRLPAVEGASVRELVDQLHLNRIERMPAALDCDTLEDLERLEKAARASD
jgi:molybdopterin-guanine dinucleotide biosynthesis protein A